MASLDMRNQRALLFGLEEPLAFSLSETLSLCNCIAVSHTPQNERPRADIVFCSHSPEILAQALDSFRNVPVVVVSRLPEVDGWLDALEAGAADYCAAPFEPIHLRWLLDTHARVRKAQCAAA